MPKTATSATASNQDCLYHIIRSQMISGETATAHNSPKIVSKYRGRKDTQTTKFIIHDDYTTPANETTTSEFIHNWSFNMQKGEVL